LAERALQYADTKTLTAEAQYTLGRAYQAQGDLPNAFNHYGAAVMARPDFIPAALASAHLLLASEIPVAINAYENALTKQPNSIEILVALAAVHSHNAFAATSEKDVLIESDKAKEKYEEVLRLLAAVNQPDFQAPSGTSIGRIQAAGQDSALYIEVARLWAGTDSARSLKAYQTSMSVRQDAGEDVPAALLNNIGCLLYGKKNASEAQHFFQEALKASQRDQAKQDVEAALTTSTYNLAIASEAVGETETATELYKQILLRHPEWFEGSQSNVMSLFLAKCYVRKQPKLVLGYST